MLFIYKYDYIIPIDHRCRLGIRTRFNFLVRPCYLTVVDSWFDLSLVSSCSCFVVNFVFPFLI